MKLSLGLTSHTYKNRVVLGTGAARVSLAKHLLQGQNQSSYGNKNYTSMYSVGYCLLVLEPVV